MKNKDNFWINKNYKYNKINFNKLQKPKSKPLEEKKILRNTIPLNSNANAFVPTQLFNNQMGSMIKIDLDKSNNSNKQFDSIFKILLGIDSTQSKPLDNKINKIKEFDLNKKYKEITTKIETLDDLINLPTNTKINILDKEEYTIDINKIVEMKEVLIELKNMIGMHTVKKSIIKQIIYFLQNIEEQQDMLHMIITGSPGTGKTSLGILLAKLYFKMGIIESKPSINPLTGKQEEFNFKIYKRSDLVGQYLGHTAIKTQKAIDECIGGIMFLDEAYSLGNDEKSDIYTKECLDTINQNLSENKNKFILIIAGYPDQLDKCFFAHNEGLRRRFSFRYHIDRYNAEELIQILKYKIISNNWKLDESINDKQLINLIETAIESFDNFGGDIQTWLLHIKIEHGVRIFGKHPSNRKLITIEDLKKGLIEFKNSKIINKNISIDNSQYMYM